MHCKTSSHWFKKGAKWKLILSLYFCVCCSHIISYLLSLSVNHYLENVPVIMVVRFKPAEGSEELCTVKKKKMLLQTKALSVWQIKTYLWKWRGCFVFFKCLISYSFNSFSVKHYILIRVVFFIPPSSLSVGQASTSALVTHVDELRGPPTVAWGGGVRRLYITWRKLSILTIVFEVFFSNVVLLLLTAFFQLLW